MNIEQLESIFCIPKKEIQLRRGQTGFLKEALKSGITCFIRCQDNSNTNIYLDENELARCAGCKNIIIDSDDYQMDTR